MAILYVIRDWPKHYENNRTRELKVLDWIRLPVKMDGDGYTELVDHPEGAAHFGAWIALLEVAARCETRGTLLRGDRNGVRRPHDAASLSRLTRLPAAVLEAAIDRLLDIGWLDAQPFEVNGLEAIPQESRTCPAPVPHDPAPVPQESGDVSARARACDSRETREEEIRGEEKREETALAARPSESDGSPPPPAIKPPDDLGDIEAEAVIWIPIVGKVPAKRTRGFARKGPDGWEYGVSDEQVEEWKVTYPGIDVLAILRQIRQWNLIRPAKRKTYPSAQTGGVLAHICGWLAKDQNRGVAPTNGRPADGLQRPLPTGATPALAQRMRDLDELMRNQPPIVRKEVTS